MVNEELIDVRDLIERFEELSSELERVDNDNTCAIEYSEVSALLEDIKYNDGTYPSELIHESAFKDYINSITDDAYNIPHDLPLYINIEYDYAVARMDYSEVEYEGSVYLYKKENSDG